MKKLGLLLVCAVCLVVLNVRAAKAIPPFNKVFLATYADNADLMAAAKQAKCNVCHDPEFPKDKKKRNPYGMELSKLLDKKKDAKDVDAIKAAIEKVSDIKPDGSEQTFGEKIAAGKLPGA